MQTLQELRGEDFRDPNVFPRVLERDGACIVRGVLDAGRVREASSSVVEAFHLPLENRLLHARTQGRSGYTPANIEHVIGAMPDIEWHAWDWLRPSSDGTFPAGLDVQLMRTLSAECERLAMEVCRTCDVAFRSSFEDLAGDGRRMLRAIEYLNTQPSDTVLFKPHTDFNLLTVALGGSINGLEVWLNGGWQPVFIHADAVLIGAGRIWRMLRPSATSFRHRVVARSIKRVSWTYFVDLRDDVMLPSGERADAYLARMLNQSRTTAS